MNPTPIAARHPRSPQTDRHRGTCCQATFPMHSSNWTIWSWIGLLRLSRLGVGPSCGNRPNWLVGALIGIGEEVKIQHRINDQKSNGTGDIEKRRKESHVRQRNWIGTVGRLSCVS